MWENPNGITALGYGTHYRNQEKRFWGLHKTFSMGCLEEEPKARGSDPSCLGRNKYGKTEIRWWKGLLAYKQASWSICLPGCALHVTIAGPPAFSLSSISNSFPEWELSILCVWGSACSNWGHTMGHIGAHSNNWNDWSEWNQVPANGVGLCVHGARNYSEWGWA